MIRCWTIAACVCLAMALAQAASRPVRSNEPFTSLRVIDRQLSIVNREAPKLNSGTSGAERTRSVRRMRAALAQIRRRSERLASLYRGRGQRFGVKMFGELDRKARSAERSLISVQAARSSAERDRTAGDVTKSTLAVVLQFQAISANMGANRCESRQWACCEPKRNPETNRETAEGCTWTCVSKAKACTGFTGPQTPLGIPGPR